MILVYTFGLLVGIGVITVLGLFAMDDYLLAGKIIRLS